MANSPHGYDGYFQSQQKYARYRIRVRCNWNLAINSFTEGYHTAYIHRNTAPDYQGGKKIRSATGHSCNCWRAMRVIRPRPIRSTS